MVASTKTLKFISATVYETKETINIQKKRNIAILKISIRNKHPRDYRVIDVMVGSAKP